MKYFRRLSLPLEVLLIFILISLIVYLLKFRIVVTNGNSDSFLTLDDYYYYIFKHRGGSNRQFKLHQKVLHKNQQQEKHSLKNQTHQISVWVHDVKYDFTSKKTLEDDDKSTATLGEMKHEQQQQKKKKHLQRKLQKNTLQKLEENCCHNEKIIPIHSRQLQKINTDATTSYGATHIIYKDPVGNQPNGKDNYDTSTKSLTSIRNNKSFHHSTTKTMSTEQQVQKSTVVIHIGTFKTGTTTIQKNLKRFEDSIQLYDNYIIPGNWTVQNKMPHRKGWTLRINMVKLADCFRLDINDRHRCSTDILNQIQTIASSNSQLQNSSDSSTSTSTRNNIKNVVLSSEFFSQSYINVSAVYEFLMQKYPSSASFGRIIVVAYYRRYYDWLVSFWKQLTKLQPYNKRQTFVNFLEQQFTKEIYKYYYDGPYTYGSIINWNETASNTIHQIFCQQPSSNCNDNNNDRAKSTTTRTITTDTSTTFVHKTRDDTKEIIIKLYNTHTIKTDISENFFCDAIPDTANTCQATKEWIGTTDAAADAEKRSNISPKISYENLLYEALIMYNLTTTTKSRNNDDGTTTPSTIISKNVYTDKFYFNLLVQKVQQFHETRTTTIMGRKPYSENDFPDQYLVCLSDDKVQWLYDRTIESEQLFFPQYYFYKNNNSTSEEQQEENSAILLQEQFTMDRLVSKKFCSVNVRAVLMHDTQWKNFFLHDLS